ncbi:MAG: 30S ribosomal protein S7 [Armatimonadaceae bacterium]
MPRKGPAPKRIVTPDPIYNSRDVTRFINRMMVDGKKSVAEGIFYTTMDSIEQRTGRPGIEVFQEALKRVMPQVEVKPRRVGGATYQVPTEVRPERRMALGIRWLITFARRRNGRSMVEKLTAELMDAANGTGGAVRRREESFKMAEANKAFSHYRF